MVSKIRIQYLKINFDYETGLMNLSIVIVFSVSWADAKLVTDRAGIPILLINVVRRPENTQHWPYLTGSPVSINCFIILTYEDQNIWYDSLDKMKNWMTQIVIFWSLDWARPWWWSGASIDKISIVVLPFSIPGAWQNTTFIWWIRNR